MLSFDEAQKRILALAERLGEEPIPAARAVGRVLARDVCASHDAPAFDASTMDGYAVRAADIGAEPLVVVGESRAGAAGPALPTRAACRIFTGAPMPEGADTVVMQEEVTRDGDRVAFRAAYAAGTNVRRRGEDLRSGDVALHAGARIGPAELAMLASLDLATAHVARAPRVIVVPTGDELRAPGATQRGEASIPESNSPALAAMAAATGAVVEVRAPVGDDPSGAKDAFGAALDACDVLVTVGGVSVGDHDVVRPALEACGVTLEFWRVAIKPGKPLAVGRRGAVIVLGLPGNPVSAMVTFALFGVPLLRALQGDARPLPRMQRGRLTAAVRRKAGRLEFARATIETRGDDSHVTLLPQQASGAIVGLCHADALACLPADAESLDAGAQIGLYTRVELGL